MCLFLVIGLANTFPFRPALRPRPALQNPAILSGAALANQYRNNGASSGSLLPLWIILGIIFVPIGLCLLWILSLILYAICVETICPFLRQQISDRLSKIIFCCGFCKSKAQNETQTVPDTQIEPKTHPTTTVKNQNNTPYMTAIALNSSGKAVPHEDTIVEYRGTKVPWCTIYM